MTRAQNNSSVIAMPNGSFEAPVYGASPYYGYQPANSEWKWSGLAGVQRNGSGLGAVGAPSGSQTAFLQGSGSAGNQGAFWQKVTLPTGSYKVTFKAAQRATGAAVPIQIKMDSTAIGAPISPTSTAFANYESAPFEVGADGTYLLGFSTDSGSGVSMSLIDVVAVESVQPVVGGGFENPVTSSYGYQPANSAWDWSGLAGIRRNGSLGSNAPEGVQTAFLQGSSNPGAFSQNITVSAAGNYQVKFKAARQATGGGVPVQISIDNAAQGAPITPTSTNFAGYSSVAFTLSPGTHALRLSTPSPSGDSRSLIDDVKVQSTSSVVLPAPVAPPTVSGLFATSATGRVSLAWSPVGGATGYRIKRGTASGGPYLALPTTESGTSFADSSVDNGIAYYYRVYALKGTIEGGDSDEVSATPLASPIVTTSGVIASGGNYQVRLNWQPVAGATSYSVVRTSSPGGSVPVSGTTATDNNLNPSTVYSYQVKALNASGFGVTPINGTTLPGAPTNVSATANSSASSIQLNWGNFGGPAITAYKIKRATAPGGPYTTLSPNVSGTQFTDTGLQRTTYYYRVYAVNASGNGPESSAAWATIIAPPPAPTNLRASPGDTIVRLNWNSVNGADKYIVTKATAANGPYSLVGETTNFLYYDVGGLTNGTTYYFRVTASNAAGPSPASSTVSAKPLARPVAPTNLVAVAGNGKVNLSWTAVAGATSYGISIFSAPNNYEAENSPSASFVHDNLTNGVTYYYSVSAVNASGFSPDSNQVSATPLAPPPAAPTNLIATAGNTRVTLNWGLVAGATSYKIKRSTTNGGPYTTLPNEESGDTYTDTSLTNGTTYYYRVYAVNSGGSSPDSNQAQATPFAPVTPPATPLNLVATAGNTEITLNWGASNNATSYKIKRSTTNGGPYTTLTPDVPASPYTDTGLVNGTTYYYRVYAVNNGGNSPDSNQDDATPFATVTPTPTPIPPTAPDHLVDLTVQAMTLPTQNRQIIGSEVYFPDPQQGDFSISNRGTATFQVTVINRGNAVDNFRLSGRGDAPGWKVRYFDAFTGGSEISSQVKGNTYIVANVQPDAERPFRVEVTPDATVPVSNDSGDNSDPGAYAVPVAAYAETASFIRDQVTARATVATAPTPPPAPIYKVDAAVRVASQTTYAGTEVYFPATQTITSVASNSTPAVYNLKVTNKGTVADNFRVKLPVPSGWSVFLYDALDGGVDRTSVAQNSLGFDIGSLAPSQSRELRIEVKPNVGVAAPLSINATVTSANNSNVKDVCTLTTSVGTVAIKPVVTFILPNGSVARACAGGIPNALHQITLTLHASNNGADLGNTAFRLSFENNVGHDSGTTEPLRTARIRRQSDNTWQESLIVTTDSSGNASVTVLSSDVISQLRLIAQPQGQNDIVGGLVCHFEAATSKRGSPDPTVGEYPGWQDDDTGWTCNVSSLAQQGDTVEGKVFIKCKDEAGVLRPVVGHKIRVFIKSAGLGGNNAVYDPDEMLAYLGFVDGSGTVQSSVEVTTAADGSATFALKANAGAETLRKLNFGGEDQSQWGN